MAINNNVPANNKSNNIVLLIIGFFVLLMVTSVASFQVGVRQTNAKSSFIPRTTPSPSSNPVKFQGITEPTVYKSDKLGISFVYAANLGGLQRINVKETKNKIYLYVDGQSPESGKFVEVSEKEAKDTLEQALLKRANKAAKPNNCRYSGESIQSKSRYYPSGKTYTLGDIGPANIDANASIDVIDSEMRKCNPSSRGGVGYFLTDSVHPNKLLYFSFGHDNLPSGLTTKGNNMSYNWDETIQFLD